MRVRLEGMDGDGGGESRLSGGRVRREHVDLMPAAGEPRDPSTEMDTVGVPEVCEPEGTLRRERHCRAYLLRGEREASRIGTSGDRQTAGGAMCLPCLAVQATQQRS